MRDGRTVKRRAAAASPDPDWEATLVVIEGTVAGREHPLEGPRVVLGRGPGVELGFDDPEMSQRHAALELAGSGLRVIDLGSTNGTRVNGEPVTAHAVEHGDRIAIGRHVLQLVLEKRDAPPRTWTLPDDDER